MEKEKRDNTGLIMLLIIMSMGVIIFCCYLIYRQHLILKQEQEKIAVCMQSDPNQLSKRKYVQVIEGTKGNIQKVQMTKDGKICIIAQKFPNSEEKNEFCMEINGAVYAYLDEKEEKSNIYVITEEGFVTRISLTKELNTVIEEKFRGFSNIVRIYQDENGDIVFVNQDAEETKLS